MDKPLTLVWIDARGATILHLRDATLTADDFASDVPSRHRTTVHVRHDPTVRHGGGMSQAAADAARVAHLDRFLAGVARRISPDSAVLILGSGPVRHRLAHRLRSRDMRRGRKRDVQSRAAPRMTRPQLVERLLRAVGQEPRKRTVGAYRWSHLDWARAGRLIPRRVRRKPSTRAKEPRGARRLRRAMAAREAPR